jgi:hypothetical protein
VKRLQVYKVGVKQIPILIATLKAERENEIIKYKIETDRLLKIEKTTYGPDLIPKTERNYTPNIIGQEIRIFQGNQWDTLQYESEDNV